MPPTPYASAPVQAKAGVSSCSRGSPTLLVAPFVTATSGRSAPDCGVLSETKVGAPRAVGDRGQAVQVHGRESLRTARTRQRTSFVQEASAWKAYASRWSTAFVRVVTRFCQPGPIFVNQTS